MSVAPSIRRIVIGPLAAASPVALAITFPVAAPDADLTILRRRNGVITELAFATEWTWAPALLPGVGGTVTVIGGGALADAYAAIGDYAHQRDADIPLASRYSSASHNRELDRLWQSLQEIGDEATRALKQDAFAGFTDPYDASGRRIKLLADGLTATDAATVGQVVAAVAPLSDAVVEAEAAAATATAQAAIAVASATAATGVVSGLGQRFRFAAATADADPGPGNLRLNGTPQNASTLIFIDTVNVTGADVSATLDAWAASTNPIKGFLRIYSMLAPDRFIEGDVTAVAVAAGYRRISFMPTATGQGPSPFAAGDELALTLNRDGNAGVGNVVGPNPGPIAGLIARFVGTTGKEITGGGTDLALVSGAMAAPELPIASAATCDVGSMASRNVEVTGNVTITSFGTAVNRYRRLRFTGALTLVHNAVSLRLPGRASIIVQPDDTAVFTSDGAGNWLCESYQRASGASLVSGVHGTRQTVLSAPCNADGNPTFIPAASANLTLTTTGLDPANPLVLSGAFGFGAAGATDATELVAANFSWTLPANATSYFWRSPVDGSLGSTILAPIYQRGGPISTVNGQHTFDITQMRMFVGDGAAANPVNRVFIGEAVTNATTVTAAVAYAVRGQSVWSDTNPLAAAGALVTARHNIGAVGLPGRARQVDYRTFIRCLVAESGWSVNDLAVLRQNAGGSIVDTELFDFSSVAASMRMGSSSSNDIIIKNTGSRVAATAANWRYYITFQRNW